MRLPRADDWSAAGDPNDGTAFVTYRRFPVHWWLVDRWLAVGHPHWEWWYRLWSRILPYWGDPFCAAYVTVWARLYSSRVEDQATIEVGWDKLPNPVKSGIVARQVEDAAYDERTGIRGTGRGH